MTEAPEKAGLTALTTEIVSAYAANNSITVSDLPDLIDGVSDALRKAAASEAQPLKEELKPAVSIGSSVKPDYLVCLEDGKRFKAIKRHLRTHHGLSPDEYREKWGLKYDYPMVASNYSEARSAMAKKIGLGRKRKK